MLEAIQSSVLCYLVAGLLTLLTLAGCGLFYQHSVTTDLRAALALTEAHRDLAKAQAAAATALIEAHQALGKSMEGRVRDAEATALLLAKNPKPLPPAPKGCAPAAAWARSADTKAAVLEHWQ